MKRPVAIDADVARSARVGRAMCSRAPIRIAVALLAAMGQSAAASGSNHGAFGTGDAKGNAAYTVHRWTVDGGGGRWSGGAYIVTGTIAQPDSDPLQPSMGGGYAITGGFWPGIVRTAPTTMLFADGFEPTPGNGTATAAIAIPQDR